MVFKRVGNVLPMVAMVMLLTACGGGGSDTTTNVTPPVPPTTPVQPAVVTGVATPDSLAVVTATNAG